MNNIQQSWLEKFLWNGDLVIRKKNSNLIK